MFQRLTLWSRPTAVIGPIMAVALCATPHFAFSQGYGAPGAAASSQARSGAEDRAFQRRSSERKNNDRTFYGGAALTDEPLAAVKFEGNNTIPSHAIASLIGSQAGRPAYEAQVSADVRKLYEKRWFRSVVPLIQQSDEGPILVFQVREQPIVGTVEFRGNKKLKTKKLIAECGLVPNRSPYDTIANKKCVDRIERLYRDKGYREVSVQLAAGAEEDGRNVIFEIAEGPKIVVDGFQFVGNRDISSGILKTKVATKRRWVWAIGGVFDPETLVDDEIAIKQYYQNLGYFDAEVQASAMRSNPNSGSLKIRYDIKEGPLYSIGQIRFEGNVIFADGDLRSRLELNEGERFLARVLRKDLESLKDVYDEQARPFAQVNFEREFAPTPGVVNLVYRFDEDVPRRIGKINVTIRGDDPHTKEHLVIHQISRSLTPGAPARAKDIRLATERIRGNQIWDPAEQPSINIRPVDGFNYLSPAIARGQNQHLEYTQLSGQTNGSSLPIGHSMLRPVSPIGVEQDVRSLPRSSSNDAYPEIDAELKRSTQGFYDWLNQPEPPEFLPMDGTGLGSAEEESDEEVVVGRPIFRGQSFSPGYGGPAGTFRSQSIDRRGQPVPQSLLPGGSAQGDPFGGTLGGQPPGFVDIDIDVTEARTGRFMFGAGVNSDAGVVGQIVLEENNFDLFNPPRSFADFRNGRAWRGAGQSFRIEAAPGAEVSRYLVNWNDPYFLGTDYSFGVSGFYYTRFFTDWTEERLGGRITIGKTLNQYWSASAALRLENVDVSNVIDNAGNNAPAALRDTVGSNFLSTARVNVAYDTRDSSFLPTKGFLAEYSFEQAFGEFNYPRAEINASQYWTVFERPDGYGKQTVRLSGRAGFLGADAPVFEQYFAGGFQSLRGWEFRGVSPLSSGTAPSTARRTGGDFLFTGTLEYMFPLTASDNFKGVVFTDFGTVDEDVTFDKFRASAGFGLRVNVPAMGPAPLAFDFAFPLVDEVTDERRVFSFYVGLTR